ncbi:MAG: hypothetical protein IKQ92_06650 [Clostridia bacterium]|nr:hypothetical protein [Clostridia bacterium]
MPKECAACKKPADVAARISRGDRTVNVCLCNDCLNRISQKHRIETIEPIRNEAQPINPERTGNDSSTPVAKRNPWKIAFFVLLAVFLLVVIVSYAPTYIGKLGALTEAKVGDTVKTENWELTLDGIEFSRGASYWYSDNDDREVLPTNDDTTAINVSAAGEDRCYLWVKFTLNYIGKTKTLFSTDLLQVQADYDDGYMYKLGLSGSSYEYRYHYFEPKGSSIEIVIFGDVPLEIEKNTNIPLRITFSGNKSGISLFDGETIVFRIR